MADKRLFRPGGPDDSRATTGGMNRRRFLNTLAVAGTGALLGIQARGGPGRDELQRNGTQASMWIYLWDLADEGYSEVLARLKDHRLTSLSMATAYHAGRFLAPHNPKRRVIFLEDGSVYFTPAFESYGRIRPRVNSLVTAGHDLQRVRREAERFGLETRSWVVCCHNTPLGTDYPDVTVVNAFGDRMVHSLCPSHPDVRSYLRALLRDIAGTGVTTIELEALAFPGFAHGFHHEREGMTLPLSIRFLLGLCFCPACQRRAADVRLDLPRIRQYATTTLERYFSSPADPVPSGLDELPAEMFEPHRLWREKVVASLLEELCAEVAPTGAALRPMASIDPAARRFVASDLHALTSLAGSVLVLGYTKDGAALRALLGPEIERLGAGRITVGHQVGLPESGGKEEFLDRLAAAKELGIISHNFYNYGFIPLERLQWIRQVL